MLAPARCELDPGEDEQRRPPPATAEPLRVRARRRAGGRRAAAARHGFSAWKTSPNSTLANAIPTQKMIRTKTGVKFDSASSRPDVAGDDRHHEQREAERAEHDLDRAASRARAAAGQRAPAVAARAAAAATAARARRTRRPAPPRRPRRTATRESAGSPAGRARGPAALSTPRPQRRIAKKTWMPLLQRNVIFEPLKSRQLKPCGLRCETR